MARKAIMTVRFTVYLDDEAEVDYDDLTIGGQIDDIEVQDLNGDYVGWIDEYETTRVTPLSD